MFYYFIFLIGGIALLYAGAECLVQCSVKLAKALNIRPFIIGLTVISFVSSVPELGISLTSVFKNQAEIMVGNIIGSNAANIGLIIGIASLIRPLEIQKQIIRRDILIMALATVIFLLFIFNRQIYRIEGLILFAGIIVFNLILLNDSRKKRENNNSNISEIHHFAKGAIKYKTLFLSIILGIVILVAGSQIIVTYAVKIATGLGIRKIIISLSLISIGTALPELGTAIVSSIRKETDFLVGNIIGSNIYNLFFVVGFTTTIHPFRLANNGIIIQLMFLLILTFIFIYFSIRNSNVSRFEGSILLILYLCFISYLFIPTIF